MSLYPSPSYSESRYHDIKKRETHLNAIVTRINKPEQGAFTRQSLNKIDEGIVSLPQITLGEDPERTKDIKKLIYFAKSIVEFERKLALVNIIKLTLSSSEQRQMFRSLGAARELKERSLLWDRQKPSLQEVSYLAADIIEEGYLFHAANRYKEAGSPEGPIFNILERNPEKLNGILREYNQTSGNPSITTLDRADSTHDRLHSNAERKMGTPALQPREQSAFPSQAVVASSMRDIDSANERLQRLLVRLDDLDMTGKIINRRWKCGGGYADIYIGEMNDSLVAIKKVRLPGKDEMIVFTKKLVREMRVWAWLLHDNILPLKGFIREEETGCPSMVTEWMENGSLRQFLQKNINVDVLFIIEGIANGLHYLHFKDVVHGDLKADNVVVSAKGIPLITDFGISHILSSTQTVDTATDAEKGTVRWQSRELLFGLLEASQDAYNPLHHTKESDIWAYGMTCLEVLTRKVPYCQIKDFRVALELDQRRLPEAPSDLVDWSAVHRKLFGICLMCWKWESIERPTIPAVIARIQSIHSFSLLPLS